MLDYVYNIDDLNDNPSVQVLRILIGFEFFSIQQLFFIGVQETQENHENHDQILWKGNPISRGCVSPLSLHQGSVNKHAQMEDAKAQLKKIEVVIWFGAP